MRLNKLFLLIPALIFSKNLNYVINDIHSLIMPKSKVLVVLEKQKINDTIDIFNIKESELKSIKKYDAIGDMDGYRLNIKYGLNQNSMLNLEIKKQNIQMSSQYMHNKNYDIFLRYNFLQNNYFSKSISFDIGYVVNKMDDLYIYDLQTINDLAKRYYKDTKFYIDQIKDDNDPILNKGDYFIPDLNTPNPNDKIILNEKPYAVIKDTDDKSYYLRLIGGFYTTNSYHDFYGGVKLTKIKNTITANNELVKKAKTQGKELLKILDRDEKMVFIGYSYSKSIKKYIIEFNYQYDRFFRDSGLDYINYNHIMQLHIARIINKNLFVYIGGKAMYRQFNGEIPYLYNKYSQTTYDHKYGYAKIGFGYLF